MKIIIALIMLCFLIQPAFSRLNETLDECRKRYGTETNYMEEINSYRFEKAGFVFLITFYNDKADSLFICKKERDELNNPKEMSENEIKTFVDANLGKGKWEEVKEISTDKSYKTKDDTIYAFYKSFDNYLLIMTDEYLQRSKEEREKKESATMQDF